MQRSDWLVFGVTDLEKERGSWLNHVDTLLLLAVQAGDVEIRRESRNCLIWSMQDDAPYAAMARLYLTEICPKLANPQVPHPFVDGATIQQRIVELIVRHHDALGGFV